MTEQPRKIPFESLGWLGFHHVALVTPDLDATILFYENTLGMHSSPVYPATSQRGRNVSRKTRSRQIYIDSCPERFNM
ncbi:VOC family protein [Cohnella suwonensis]|uniref:VOC family protein n=1 Tax=Cohnella suwonensis TaxID=696072 RepID=A0ABW0M0U6_9BACL